MLAPCSAGYINHFVQYALGNAVGPRVFPEASIQREVLTISWMLTDLGWWRCLFPPQIWYPAELVRAQIFVPEEFLLYIYISL